MAPKEVSKKDLLDTLDLMGLLIEGLRKIVDTNKQESYDYPVRKPGPLPLFFFTCADKLVSPPWDEKPPFEGSHKPPNEPGLHR